MNNIKGVVNSLIAINNKVNNLNNKINIGWIYSSVTKPIPSVISSIVINLNLTNILNIKFIEIILNQNDDNILNDINLVNSFNEGNIKFYLHNFGSTITQILQTNYFINKPELTILNGYSTAPFLENRSNLLRFSSNDNLLITLIKKYLKNPYNDLIIPNDNSIEYIILTDPNLNNPIFVNNYVNLLKNKIIDSNQKFITINYYQALTNGLPGNKNLRQYINDNPIKSKVLFFVSLNLDPILEHLYNNNNPIYIGFYSSDAAISIDISNNSKLYLDGLTLINYPQFIISNAAYDTQFINDTNGGNGDPMSEVSRNMISFIIYKYYTNVSINLSFIDLRYFSNKDNSLGAFNLYQIIKNNPIEYIIKKRCTFSNTELNQGSYSEFENL